MKYVVLACLGVGSEVWKVGSRNMAAAYRELERNIAKNFRFVNRRLTYVEGKLNVCELRKLSAIITW